ncbi:MAG TPA: DPP IV N-terminal domain-containing protein [Acetobacteraceae bacterium]
MLPADRLARANRFLARNIRPLVFNPMVRPHWTDDRHFFYARDIPGGVEHVLVDAETGERRPFAPPAAAAPATRPGEVLSPDGRLAAFTRGNDLWLRVLATDEERPLTRDGAPHHAYAKSPDMNLTPVTLARKGIRLPAGVLWSPDSKRLFTYRLDERALGDFPMVQHVPDDGSVRPVLHNLKFALSGDRDIPTEAHLVIEVETGRIVPAAGGPYITHVMSCIERQEAWWSADGGRVFFIDRDRMWRRHTLNEMDARSGAVRAVVGETGERFTDVNLSVTGLPNIAILDASDEVVWFSQRDGWAHLYLHDLRTGALKNRITEGEWVVRDIVRVDAARRLVFFLAGGLQENPYNRVLCRVGLDGTGFAVLTPQPGDHAVAMPQHRVPRDYIRPDFDTGEGISPGADYFVHSYSSLDSLPVSELCRADGSRVAVLEEARLDPALAAGWRFPEPFTAAAADGETKLFGAIWRPTDFDPGKAYPVIDYVYPGPQRGVMPTVMLTDNLAELGRSTLPQAFAELGFIVVCLDGRGTPLRSKAFHELSHGRLDNPGTLEDHIAVLRELARRHKEFDLSRVGIMGHSAGGYTTARAMLRHPEFFHVGVSTSGNHDQKGYSFAWTEKFQGELVRHADGSTSYDAAANPALAHRLQGKLLLAYGDMDDNVHPALTIQLVDALIKADKDFDVLVLPGDDHTTVWSNPWFLRRAMEFMVTHLRADATWSASGNA